MAHSHAVSSLSRRGLIAGMGASGAALLAPRLAFAAGADTDRRLLFIIQRGAADGLSTLAPLGDPAFAGVRGQLAKGYDQAPKLDSLFALHPSLATTATLYRERQALFLHAVASPYRDRSHFDAQNVLETGGTLPYQLKDGWMNRLLSLLPGGTRAMAVGATVPVALRGGLEVASYANSALPDADEGLMERVSQLYSADPQLHMLWDNALQARNMAGPDAEGKGGKAQDPKALGQLAAKLMTGAQGARIAMVETGGWDTHFNQAARIGNQLRQLDALIGSYRDGLGPQWGKTLVIVATEFGRTVAVNGTQGTDHGTGSMAMLLGGAVNGGRIIADWPGLRSDQLYEGRDLRPTASLDLMMAGALGEHFGIDPTRLLARTFPESRGKPIEGLVRQA